ncbi:hypothetical protein [Leucobacter sp. OH1287]|uniref:hypothetical protein n=1 Tax=Leucobacter sp. OH1287 TaxID=2491049 RepID=UPI000F5FF7A3|nr:hypothetical protein [Leucobacter sp. OH1287]RRD59637.1 hypothetical protein EII30_08410 [Leucobacter sp. OH1287]
MKATRKGSKGSTSSRDYSDGETVNDRVRRKQLWLLNTALLVIALLLPGVQFLAGSAKETTNQVLDENWRGSYDILFTHSDFHAEIAAAKNDLGLDLVEVNYGNIAAPTISAEQLSQVRETPGVAVAAPLGYLGAQPGLRSGRRFWCRGTRSRSMTA